MSVVIAVSDHGIGIDSQSVPHLFEPFFRADDSLTSPVPGTGLGLTISNQIAIEHGGSIEYRENEGGGSIFELHLPLRSNL
jgi:signal transduction histidine kinase